MFGGTYFGGTYFGGFPYLPEVIPPEIVPIEEVISDGVCVTQLAAASAINCTALVASSCVTVVVLGQAVVEEPTVVISDICVRQLVTSTAVEGWKR